ncbi:Zn-ribbon domain-containing OB-fold protein [Gordonia rubripertincta]|uniref:OB-fold domain-containing protein n=1 Tax=Gordonia rubripertincta TaxID=36822 RepID=A0ABT4MVP0_GORRU|nr:OB-fold domain-containing protein [Gordonia rubripertincta]MCZ4551075.1 OB-fold domain-containing protein [Gordonia rubripertincta]
MTHDIATSEADPPRVSQCSNCGHRFTYPRLHCARCGSLSISSAPLDGYGTVYAVTVVRTHPDPEFRALTPYAVAYVDLDGGGRVLARLTGEDSAAAAIGDRVRLSPTASSDAAAQSMSSEDTTRVPMTNDRIAR